MTNLLWYEARTNIACLVNATVELDITYLKATAGCIVGMNASGSGQVAYVKIATKAASDLFQVSRYGE